MMTAPLCLLALLFAVEALQPTLTPPLLDSPTFSLATTNKDGSTNMNILTYASPVSVRPDRVWSLGLYKETLSYCNFMRTQSCVLQLLTDEHIPLVELLGGKSGREADKETGCMELGCKWIEQENVGAVLPNCASYLKLSLIGSVVDVGSHAVAICKVQEMLVPKESKAEHLSTGKLRGLGIITEQGRVADKAL